jgi:hypothetical protein
VAVDDLRADRREIGVGIDAIELACLDQRNDHRPMLGTAIGACEQCAAEHHHPSILPVVNFRCERWRAPDGGMVTAPLPAGIDRHFGPELRCFVLAQYHQGQTTVPRPVTLSRGFGIVISKRQVMRLLINGQDGFCDEARDVLRAKLLGAPDKRGQRH